MDEEHEERLTNQLKDFATKCYIQGGIAAVESIESGIYDFYIKKHKTEVPTEALIRMFDGLTEHIRNKGME